MTRAIDELERLMRVVAHTAALASVLETVLVEQLRAHTEREALKAQLGRLDAIQAQVEHLTARLATYDEGPLLPNGAFGRMQRAQRERADLSADLSRLRERYVDAPDSDDLSVSSDGASASPGK
jgi:hypothetical protein